jgi:hypothetical protein
MAADLGAGIFAWAQTVDTLTALLGSGDAMQLYPVATLSTKPLPFSVYEEERDTAYTTHDGPPSLASSKVMISSIAADPQAANDLAEAFRAVLDHFSGTMGTVRVQGVIYEGSSPAYQWEEQQFAVDATFKFWYTL